MPILRLRAKSLRLRGSKDRCIYKTANHSVMVCMDADLRYKNAGSLVLTTRRSWEKQIAWTINACCSSLSAVVSDQGRSISGVTIMVIPSKRQSAIWRRAITSCSSAARLWESTVPLRFYLATASWQSRSLNEGSNEVRLRLRQLAIFYDHITYVSTSWP